MYMKGKIIVIEGLDGSGKGTQTPLLCDFLKSRGKNIKRLSFPCYESKSSELVKMYLSGELGSNISDVNSYAASTFYAVDRYASFITDWKQKYETGSWFVADRYATSNIIYQMEKLETKNNRDEFIDWVEDFEYCKLGIPRPDLVLYLDMPVEISQRLMESRYKGDNSKKDLHEKNVEFLKNCRKTAIYAAERCGWKIISCSDGENPFSIEEIHKKIINTVSEDLL